MKYKGLEIEAPVRELDGGISVSWSCPSFGFGDITIYWKDEELCADGDIPDEELIAAVMAKMARYMNVT